MTHAILIAAMAAAAGIEPCPRPTPINLTGYQHADGAITLRPDATHVEPYFATKALLVAHEAGMDVRAPALAWIDWLRARQLPDGRFERYCGRPGEWTVCGDADADDAMLALWMQLLFAMGPPDRLHGDWVGTLVAAESHLDSLRDPARGVYFISRNRQTALFMDNVEVYGALRQSAAARRRHGDQAHAGRLDASADALARSIEQVFYQPARRRYEASTQPRTELLFYPDEVAQIYPWLVGYPTHRPGDRELFRAWLRTHRRAWESRELDYAWGLVAMTAARLGDDDTAERWVRRSKPHRGTLRWNVLEEAIYQALSAKCE